MSMPDKKFPWIWTAYLIAVVGGFAIIEGLALAFHDTTLSRYTWEVNQAWPLFIPLICLVFGVVITHFVWHWNPPGSKSDGG